MKTTNKCFKEQIQTHILERLTEEDFINDDYKLSTTKDKIELVVKEFKNWYNPYEQKVTPNLQTAFIGFLQGLPSCLNIEFTYHNIHETMKEWFEKCGETYRGEHGGKESDYYYKLIYREFKNLCKIYKVTF
jgi:hypothetical protein